SLAQERMSPCSHRIRDLGSSRPPANHVHKEGVERNVFIENKLLLAGKEVIDRLLGDVCQPGDIGHGHGVITPGSKQGLRRIRDLLVCLHLLSDTQRQLVGTFFRHLLRFLVDFSYHKVIVNKIITLEASHSKQQKDAMDLEYVGEQMVLERDTPIRMRDGVT